MHKGTRGKNNFPITCKKEQGEKEDLQETYLWYELPFKNFTFGDDHDRPNAIVHFP